ncbi:MAG: ATP-binding protein [Gammaproteobacteria bacterium]
MLAVILVAVAIGAVGITLVSLFVTAMNQERESLVSYLDGVMPDAGFRQVATLSLREGRWSVELGNVPPVVLRELPLQVSPENLSPGELRWLEGSGGDYLAAVRPLDADSVQLAWLSLDSVREPYRRAALHALVAILALVMGGLWLFYRMTAPLLRHMALSEARYRTLFSSTAEGVVLVGESKIEECNDRFCEMFRCRRDQVVGLQWRDFFRRYAGGDERLESFEQRVASTLGNGRQSFLWEFSRADDESLMAEVAFRALKDGNRRLMLASLRDVTERERTARELQAAERALRESRERLAQAGRSSALIELAAGIAHEVNQPLAAIANYAQACRRMVRNDQPCSQDVAVSLDRIADQAQRAGETIHRIRSLVQTPGGGDAVACVNRLVESVALLLGEELEASGTRLVLDLSPDVSPVLADPLQIQQVLVQLLNNALEAMAGTPRAEREIRVVTRRLDGHVEVEVKDTGHGISPDDRASLFEPFYSTRENAMGMGLPICMSIIRGHKGTLEVDESLGRGACFRFRLPADNSATRSDERCRNPVVP